MLRIALAGQLELIEGLLSSGANISVNHGGHDAASLFEAGGLGDLQQLWTAVTGELTSDAKEALAEELTRRKAAKRAKRQ